MKQNTINSVLSQLIIIKGAAGLAIRKISNELGIPYSTAQWHLQQHRSNRVVHQIPKGRPRITSQKIDRTMCLTAKAGRFLKVSKLSAQFGVSSKTFRRRCKAKGLRKRQASLDSITPRHKHQRIQWCREYLN